MTAQTTVREIMVDVFEYPHIPYWFTLRQAAGIIRNTLLGGEKQVQPLWSVAGSAPAPGTAIGGKPASEAPVATVMRSTELFVEPGASIADAARLIVEHGLDLVPVLEDRKKLIGVVRWQEVFQECSRATLGG